MLTDSGAEALVDAGGEPASTARALVPADFAPPRQGLVDAGDGTNIDDEHDPEGTTIAFERAQVAALIDQARTRIADLDRALGSLAAGGREAYGICEVCGQPIAAGRLEARPSARTCIDCASR